MHLNKHTEGAINNGACCVLLDQRSSGSLDVTWVWAILLVVWSPYVFTAVSCLFQLLFKKTPALPWIPLVVVSVHRQMCMGLILIDISRRIKRERELRVSSFPNRFPLYASTAA